MDRLNEIDGVSCYRPEATFYLFPNVTGAMQRRGTNDYEQFRKSVLDETGVAFCTRLHFGRAVAGETENWNPTADEQVDFLVRHFRLMAEQHGEYSCRLFRKFAGWYGAKLGIPEDLEDRLRRFESFSAFDGIVAEIRRRHGTRRTDVATALIKTPNGPVERW